MSLVLDHVGKRFMTMHRVVHTLENITLTVNQGEFVCLLGPSGCGKSTLLNIAAGLEQPTEGKVYFKGEEIMGAGPDRAVMFQEAALFPWLNVSDNVQFALKMAGVSKKEREEKARQVLKMVHLTEFEDSFTHELSGGMRQRVALARALTMNADLLLMDEPFAALDSQTKSILQMELQQIWWETKKTIIFVTHDIKEAVLLADRVIVMAANPGRIKKEVKIQLTRPRCLENLDLSYVETQIMKELKSEVERVAKVEYDSDWDLEKDNILLGPDHYMGIGL
ncbi:MAG: ABC transporter ATP-binding protein [Desulfitobacteriaceae bacterium]